MRSNVSWQSRSNVVQKHLPPDRARGKRTRRRKLAEHHYGEVKGVKAAVILPPRRRYRQRMVLEQKETQERSHSRMSSLKSRRHAMQPTYVGATTVGGGG